MLRAKKAAKKAGMTYQQIGERMGYPTESARQSVSQLLNSTNPSLAMLMRYAKAIGVELRELV